MSHDSDYSISAASAGDILRDLLPLMELIMETVAAGASIGFLHPMPAKDAEAFWRKISESVAAGDRLVSLARARGSETPIGCVMLGLEHRPNGRHRAEVQKLMVAVSHRGRGLGTRLMQSIEEAARAHGRPLLFLDTSEGRGGARALYEKLGYTYCGGIPGYALDPDGSPANNAIFWKRLSLPADNFGAA